MCGIAGTFYSDRTIVRRETELALIKRMTDSIAHRGPDGEGHFVDDHVALGHRRLAIIDLHAGAQPLFNEDGSVVTVFNGEIYNYRALVVELGALGHHFRTHSDTEVIVHAWEQWGPKCVDRFQGMFAFVVWDARSKTLFCARDRLGVKPFYYGITADRRFFFGSELKALQQTEAFSQTLNPHAVEDYLALGYVPEDKCIFKEFSKLAPGHSLLWKVGDKSPTINCFWSIKDWNTSDISDTEAQRELESILADSIGLRMIADVPLGAFLSGGVDSSIVVALMAGISSDPIKTCSIGFLGEGFDETEYALQLANRYRTDHVVQKVTADDFALSSLLGHAFDEPFADSSAIPTYRVAEYTRKRVTVALSGDGADEMFGGYRRYWMHLGENRLRSFFPGRPGQAFLKGLSEAYPKANWAPRFLRAKSTLMAAANDPLQAYELSISAIRPNVREALLSADFKNVLSGYRAIETLRNYDRGAPKDPLARLQNLDYKTYLPSDINTKVDRTSMANSLEVRAPFLDYRLVEWAARLPSSLKIAAGSGKVLLKRTFESKVGQDILYRPKQGFSVPINSWFRGPLKDKIRSLANDGAVITSGIIDRRSLSLMVEQHVSGQLDHSTAIWTIWMLEEFLGRSGVRQ